MSTPSSPGQAEQSGLPFPDRLLTAAETRELVNEIDDIHPAGFNMHDLTNHCCAIFAYADSKSQLFGYDPSIGVWRTIGVFTEPPRPDTVATALKDWVRESYPLDVADSFTLLFEDALEE